MVSNECFSDGNKLELFDRANAVAFCRFPWATIVLVYCEIFCLWRHVNRAAHPVFNQNNNFPKAVVVFLLHALLVSIYHSHNISRHRPHKPLQKFNMCDFVARSQAFVVKTVIACDHWCPYIVRHRAPLCVLLTHVWKSGFTFMPLYI